MVLIVVPHGSYQVFAQHDQRKLLHIIGLLVIYVFVVEHIYC
jgi:hypothetical protein